MNLQEREQRVKSMWTAAWNDGEVDAMDSVLSPSFARHLSSSNIPVGREDFKKMILATREGFPDIITMIEDMISTTDRIAIRWWSRGTHLGVYRDIPPTGRTVTAAGATFARFEDDMMVEAWSTWDSRNMLTALGIIPLGRSTS